MTELTIENILEATTQMEALGARLNSTLHTPHDKFMELKKQIQPSHTTHLTPQHNYFYGMDIVPQELTRDFLSKFDTSTRKRIISDYENKGFSLISPSDYTQTSRKSRISD